MKQVATFAEHTNSMTSVSITKDEDYVISGSFDATIKIWSFEKEGKIVSLTGHTETVYSVLVAPDKQCIFKGSGDGTVKIWSLGKKSVPYLNTKTKLQHLQ